MNAWALGISLVSLVVAGLGTWLSNRRAKESRDLAREALEDSRRTRTDALWSDAIAGAMHLVGLDPTTQDAHAPFRDFRIRWAALADGLPDWAGLEPWLRLEHGAGALLSEQVMMTERTTPSRTVDDHFRVLTPFVDWAIALSDELRRLRHLEYDADDLERLRQRAEGTARALQAQTGRQPPAP